MPDTPPVLARQKVRAHRERDWDMQQKRLEAAGAVAAGA